MTCNSIGIIHFPFHYFPLIFLSISYSNCWHMWMIVVSRNIITRYLGIFVAQLSMYCTVFIVTHRATPFDVIQSLLGFNASATVRVISRWWHDDDDEISVSLVEETGVPETTDLQQVTDETVLDKDISEWYSFFLYGRHYFYPTLIVHQEP